MPEPLQNQRQRQSRLPRQTRLQPRTRLPNQRHPHQCTKTLQNHHHETVGARMARNRPDRYAIANRFPSSLRLRPSKHFTALKNNRELFGRTVQCRTGHGYTGEFRRNFKLESPYSCHAANP
jgi:hypothetical protein